MGAGAGRQWEAPACVPAPLAAHRAGCGSFVRRLWWWRRPRTMWATRGLAVALALSVLPDSRALRPGDCEGAGVRGWGSGAAEPSETERAGVTAHPEGSAGGRASEFFPGLETLTPFKEKLQFSCVENLAGSPHRGSFCPFPSL